MLLKLIKNDVKESSRKFVPIIGLIMVASLILGVMVKTNIQDMISVILVLVVFGLGVGAAVLSVMAFINLLYTSLYDKNGYRLFTYPVETWEILVSKLVTYVFWSFVLATVTIVAMIIVALIVLSGTHALEAIKDFLVYATGQIELRAYLTFAFYQLSNLIFSAVFLLFIGSVTNSSFIQNHRKLTSFILYVVLLSITSNVLMYFMGDLNGLMVNFNPDFLMNAGQVEMNITWAEIFEITTSVKELQRVLLAGMLQFTIAGLLGFVTVWFWNNKLEIVE